MNTHETIRATLDMSMMVLKSYLDDLTDAELLKRPGAGCNHLAWQLGHLISSNCYLLELLQPGSSPELPDGFAEKHSKETSEVDDPLHYYTKEQYFELFGKVNAAMLAALDKFSPEDLDAPAPENFQPMFPSVGHLFILVATHPLMHAGQFVPVRRALGKPVVI